MTKAIAFTEFGTADVLHAIDLDLPEPGPGQVRIAVRAAGVNPIDSKIRSGAMRQVFPVSFPHVPGFEAAGVVEAVGPGVTGLAVGAEVFGRVASGAYAEQALAAADALLPKPAGLDWPRAAALLVAAETTYRALERLDLHPGETLLVHGAAGGVGSVAVQFAVARGLKVIGTASEANHERLRALGAVPVRYGDGLVERVRAVAPDGVDAAFDLAGRPDALADSVELTGGTARVVTVADAAAAKEAGVAFTGGGDADRSRPAVEEAFALLAGGGLRLAVHRAYPLDRAADAQRESEGGHAAGKIVLTV
ncbi:putative alcohol dehydrogenase [Actinacidiphila reveromycinica]|uniref:Putative alcohol dehydrogenase n=1 Tax=Actinacidiphila reveromycinica TaxID=659352 RepID=A0A7U3VR26_9ACTN|nr:NADP-dependent oxidoreductase [Streptomyces sp. SN-593]BBB00289.1 putative alcohol dehydrogenase [Streptomyces sp. SN-593]